MIETGSLADIMDHRYNTDFKETAFLGSLMTWEQRFRLKTAFIPMSYAGQFIYSKLYYHAREMFK